MLRVVDYCRVSTEEEKQLNALKTQQEENEEFIKNQKDWVLVDRYVDEGKTATTTDGRYEFQKLLNDMKIDKFDIILIKILDRGWRNTYSWKKFERLLMITNKKLFIKSRNAFYDYRNPTDYMATGFEAQFAEWFSINQSQKINQAHQTRMKKGTVVTNGKLWGYTQKNAKLEINESEAKVVRYVFDSYIKGYGFRAIASQLDDMGIKSKNNTLFSLTTLKRMIKQEKYKGTLICGKTHKDFWTKEITNVPKDEWIIHDNAIPAIIDAETWQKANDILNEKKQKINKRGKEEIAGYFKGRYVYSGKIKCGICGRPFYHSIYWSEKNRKSELRYWECKGYREHGKKSQYGCKNIRIQEHELADIVKQTIFDFWNNKEDTISKITKILNMSLTENNSKKSVDSLNKEKLKINRNKNKLIELYTDDLISKKEFKEKNDDYNSQIEAINKQLKNKEEENFITKQKQERLSKINKLLSKKIQSKDNIRDEFIDELLKEIVVYPDNTIKITLNGGVIFTKELNERKKTLQNVSDSVKEWSQSEILFNSNKKNKTSAYKIAIYMSI